MHGGEIVAAMHSILELGGKLDTITRGLEDEFARFRTEDEPTEPVQEV